MAALCSRFAAVFSIGFSFFTVKPAFARMMGAKTANFELVAFESGMRTMRAVCTLGTSPPCTRVKHFRAFVGRRGRRIGKFMFLPTHFSSPEMSKSQEVCKLFRPMYLSVLVCIRILADTAAR